MQTLITTHFGDVFDYDLLAPADLCELGFYQMEIILEKRSEGPLDWEQVTPMFRLVPGRLAFCHLLCYSRSDEVDARAFRVCREFVLVR